MEIDMRPAAVLRAVRTGAVEELRTMVARDRALVLRAVDFAGRSSIHIACEAGHTEVVAALLDNDASGEGANCAVHGREWSPLLIASFYRRSRALRAHGGRPAQARCAKQRAAQVVLTRRWR